ncbi:MAG: class I SAM-dependent methyltransferase [Acidobacteria bacterium]|nr:class I SAM-dependent methyltransferase [Acidobacteriota bacterium]
MDQYYEESYYRNEKGVAYLDYEAEHANILRNAFRLIRWIEQHANPGTLVEVGSAMGFFLEAALRSGWNATGFEISEYASILAKEKYGLPVRFADILRDEPGIKPASVDAFVALDTIEHLTDPLRLLEIAHQLLRNGGLLLISTGNASSWHARIAGTRWRLVSPPEHLFGFSKRALVDLLRNSRFSTIKIRYFSKLYSLAFPAACFSIPLPRRMKKWAIPINAFDVMHILARKD